jgi:hypothetical protein
LLPVLKTKEQFCLSLLDGGSQMNMKEIGKTVLWFLILGAILIGLRHFVFTPVVVKGGKVTISKRLISVFFKAMTRSPSISVGSIESPLTTTGSSTKMMNSTSMAKSMKNHI